MSLVCSDTFIRDLIPLFRAAVCHPRAGRFSVGKRRFPCSFPGTPRQRRPPLPLGLSSSCYACLLVLAGESVSRQSRAAGCRKGKHKRRPPPGPLDSRSAFCPHLTGHVPAPQPWCPPAALSARAPGPAFPAAAAPSQGPYLVPAFPLAAVTSLGREQAASVTALDGLPVPGGWQSLTALPSPCFGAYVTVVLPEPPACPLLAPSFPPYPFLEATVPSEIPPPPSATSQRTAGGQGDAQREASSFISSRSSSPLQLDLLQEDTARSCGSVGQMRTDVCPEAQCVSDTNSHTQV